MPAGARRLDESDFRAFFYFCGHRGGRIQTGSLAWLAACAPIRQPPGESKALQSYSGVFGNRPGKQIKL